jgi:hypothetical protein
MTRTLNSIRETAVVIGGLIAAPMVVFASISSVAAAPVDRPALTMVQDIPSLMHTAELKF